jgi:hypothetical protein
MNQAPRPSASGATGNRPGGGRTIPPQTIDDVRERSFYPRPHERANKLSRRISNWLRARIGLAPKHS